MPWQKEGTFDGQAGRPRKVGIILLYQKNRSAGSRIAESGANEEGEVI